MSDASNNIPSTSPLIELTAVSPLSVIDWRWEPNSFIPPHRHDIAQLLYASQGVVSVETTSGLWVVPPTRAVWVPEDTGHSIKFSGKVQLATLQIAQPYSDRIGYECKVVNVSPLLRQAILKFTQYDDGYPEDSPQQRLANVILDEINVSDVAPLHLPMPSDKRAKKVAMEFCDAPSLRLSTAEWSQRAGASERTLERIYQAETGMTFGKWQQQARLLYSLELLAKGHSTTHTALEVGFQSASAFIAMFRNVMGTTPSKYFDLSD
jgi:AraC-like DNA-binding protein